MSKQSIILSDLHIHHGTTSLKCLSYLDTLFERYDQVILNGDTLETIHDFQQPLKESTLNTLYKTSSINKCNLILINGNHDPDVSSINYIKTGNLFITHGDIPFTVDLTSNMDVTIFREAYIRKALDQIPFIAKGDNPLSYILRNIRPSTLFRHITNSISFHDKYTKHYLYMQPLNINNNKGDTTTISLKQLLKDYRVNPKLIRDNLHVIITGHVHVGGFKVTKCEHNYILSINLGCFMSLFPCYAVILEEQDEHYSFISLHKIETKKLMKLSTPIFRLPYKSN